MAKPTGGIPHAATRTGLSGGRRSAALLAGAGVLTLALATAPPATASTGTLPLLVRTENIMAHMANLQTIADFNDDNRAHGTDGMDISRMYVIDQLERAGYKPEEHEFTFLRPVQHSDSVLTQLEPEERDFVYGEDMLTMSYSAAGDVTAPGVAVAPDSADSGCAPDDFADLPEGAIAIVQRGGCTFAQKTQNAADAGAAAIVIFNHGLTDADLGPIPGTLSELSEIPSLGASRQVGLDLVDLAATGELVLHLEVDTEIIESTGHNVIAETPGGADDNVVMVGAHLDSVEEGPGINDNGSGSAAILETAIQLARLDEPTNKVRFAWWDAEELGLHGSTHYVQDLSETEVDDLALYLNFDMIGSPNYVRFVYDGRGELEGTAAVPPVGSAAIQRMFENYFADQDMVTDPTPLPGSSDYAEFIVAGVPIGGVFSGAGGVKTEEQAERYGGTAGEPYDPNYHTADDTVDNINVDSVRELSGGIAHAVETYAESTLPVNGVVRTLAETGDVEFDRQGELWVR